MRGATAMAIGASVLAGWAGAESRWALALTCGVLAGVTVSSAGWRIMALVVVGCVVVVACWTWVPTESNEQGLWPVGVAVVLVAVVGAFGATRLVGRANSRRSVRS